MDNWLIWKRDEEISLFSKTNLKSKWKKEKKESFGKIREENFKLKVRCSKRIKPLNEPLGIVLGNFLIKNLNKNLIVKF